MERELDLGGAGVRSYIDLEAYLLLRLSCGVVQQNLPRYIAGDTLV